MDCPNCLTPWKCNGPHLEKRYDGVYNSIDGYYMLNKFDNEYKFLSSEKEFNEQQILDILNTLKSLNQQHKYS